MRFNFFKIGSYNLSTSKSSLIFWIIACLIFCFFFLVFSPNLIFCAENDSQRSKFTLEESYSGYFKEAQSLEPGCCLKKQSDESGETGRDSLFCKDPAKRRNRPETPKISFKNHAILQPFNFVTYILKDPTRLYSSFIPSSSNISTLKTIVFQV